MKCLIQVLGRSGLSATYTKDDSNAFAIYINGSIAFDYGWSPIWEDAKGGCCTYTIPANSSATVKIVAAKTAAGANLTYLLTASVLGVRN